MAQPTNTFDSYDSVGDREDLQDMIYDISKAYRDMIGSLPKNLSLVRELKKELLEDEMEVLGVKGKYLQKMLKEYQKYPSEAMKRMK